MEKSNQDYEGRVTQVARGPPCTLDSIPVCRVVGNVSGVRMVSRADEHGTTTSVSTAAADAGKVEFIVANHKRPADDDAHGELVLKRARPLPPADDPVPVTSKPEPEPEPEKRRAPFPLCSVLGKMSGSSSIQIHLPKGHRDDAIKDLVHVGEMEGGTIVIHRH